MALPVVGYLRTADGQLLISQGNHDVKYHYDKGADRMYMIDDYGYRSTGEAVMLTEEDPHSEIRQYAQWGTIRSGNIERIFVKDLDTDHIYNILKEGHGYGVILKVLQNELIFRGETLESVTNAINAGKVLREEHIERQKEEMLKYMYDQLHKDRS